MRACNACHVHVDTQTDFCPLCGAALQEGAPPAVPVPHNDYPDASKSMARYNILLRLLLFVSVLGCGISVLVNLLVAPEFLWCLIVVAGVVYAWLVVPPIVRRRGNYAGQVVGQVVFTSGLVVALDFITGYQGWSVSYVVPALLSAGIVATFLMVALNRTNWAQYVLYQVILGVFGFVPLLLYLFGVPENFVMMLVTSCLALASLLATAIFGDRSIKSEFKRRFHL